VAPICAACGPSTGGETGDFGGALVSCDHYLEDAEIDEVEAAQVSLAELERRLARPIDVPFQWKEYDDGNPTRHPLQASGYEPSTWVKGTISPTGPFRFQRQTNCSEPSHSCTECWSRIEVDVSVEFATADGSIRARTEGTAVHAVSDRPATPGSALRAYFNSSADLRDVLGTLRFEVPQGGVPHGRLTFSGWLLPDGVRGSATIFLDIDQDERSSTDLPSIEGEFFLPLTGSFGG
jgi:hypothetical protein